MKILVTNYTFDASAQTITFADYNPVVLERVLIITNVTDNIIIYNFADATKGGSVATNVLTLDYNTTSMDDNDDLQIYYDDASAEQLVDTGLLQPVQAGDTVVANLGTLNGAATAANQSTEITHLSEIEGAIETIESTVDTIGTTPLQRVAIFDAGDSQITSFGSGTQYTEGSSNDNTPTGTVAMARMPDGGDAIVGLVVDNSGNLKTVVDTSGGALAVTLDNIGDIATETTLANMNLSSGSDTGSASGNFLRVGGVEAGTTDRLLSMTADGYARVDIASSVLPTDAATAANQSTIIGHLDGVEGLLTTIDADTGTLAGTDFMLGTDFSAVFGTNPLFTTLTLDDDLANTLDVMNTRSLGYVFDGTSWDRLRGDSTNGMLVNLGGNNDVTVTGTVTVDGSGVTQPISHAALTELAAAIDTEVQVDVVGALPAGTSTIGNVGLIPRTSGGMSIFRSIDLDESEEEVKSSAGQVFSITATNMTDAPLFLKFYNATAANVTVGTTTPVLTFVVPANADSDGAGFVWNNDIGFAFSTAITVAATTGVADNDTGAPAANACIVNIGYA